MLLFLSLAFFGTGFLVSYWLWLRPMLRSRPSLARFNAQSDTFWSAVRAKFLFIKTQIAAACLMIGGFLIAIHDFLIPLALNVDWSPVAASVPAWAWPVGLFALGALFAWLRNATVREQSLVTPVQADHQREDN